MHAEEIEWAKRRSIPWAAQADIKLLHAFLGTGQQLGQGPNDLDKNNKYVSNPCGGALALFKVEGHRQDGRATSITVTCIPDTVEAVMGCTPPCQRLGFGSHHLMSFV